VRARHVSCVHDGRTFSVRTFPGYCKEVPRCTVRRLLLGDPQMPTPLRQRTRCVMANVSFALSLSYCLFCIVSQNFECTRRCKVVRLLEVSHVRFSLNCGAGDTPPPPEEAKSPRLVARLVHQSQLAHVSHDCCVKVCLSSGHLGAPSDSPSKDHLPCQLGYRNDSVRRCVQAIFTMATRSSLQFLGFHRPRPRRLDARPPVNHTLHLALV